MPTPRTHYRLALGESKGRHSWVIHSTKGIIWHNIPSELVTLLRKLSVHELLDVALGSNGRWYVRYRQKGPERHETSSSLLADLGQGSNIKLDRLTLGSGSSHWGVHRAPDGVFQSFSDVSNRDRFVELLESKVDINKSSSQIDFVSLGYGGGWAFSVNGSVEFRCGKPFENKVKEGWQAQKKLSTIVLSPMGRIWIIVWEDGTLSHNLPSNIATEVESYCQLQHSLKANSKGAKSRQPKAQKATNSPNNQPGTSSSTQEQKSTSSSTRTTNRRPKLNFGSSMRTLNTAVALNSTSAPQPATNAASIELSTTSVRISKPVQGAQSPTRAISQLSSGLQDMRLFSGTSSSQSRTSSRVDAISAEPYVYAPPRKLSTTLRSLDRYDWPDSVEYRKIARLFEMGWKHPYKQLPIIKRIFAVSLPDYLNKSYNEYKGLLESQNGWSGVNEELVFHGTTRSCSLGDDEGYINPCEKVTCRLCCILRTSFSVSMAGSAGRGFNRFGPGIYTSSVSSKADDYTNAQWYSENKVVIVAKAALGKSRIYYETTTQLTASPWGYDSVLGEVGVGLNYDEQVLYKNEAIRPAYIVVYEGFKRQWSVYDDDD